MPFIGWPQLYCHWLAIDYCSLVPASGQSLLTFNGSVSRQPPTGQQPTECCTKQTRTLAKYFAKIYVLNEQQLNWNIIDNRKLHKINAKATFYYLKRHNTILDMFIYPSKLIARMIFDWFKRGRPTPGFSIFIRSFVRSFVHSLVSEIKFWSLHIH